MPLVLDPGTKIEDPSVDAVFCGCGVDPAPS